MKKRIYVALTGVLLLTVGSTVTALGQSDLVKSGDEKCKVCDFRGALGDYTRAIEVDTADAEAYLKRGVALKVLGEFGAAVEDLNKAIELRPKYLDAYYNRATVRMEMMDYGRAIADLDRVVELNSAHADAYLARGFSKYRQGLKEEGCVDMKKASNLGNEAAPKLLKQLCN